MSTEQIARAYTEGRISRRTLVRRLVAGGISFGAAVSYAHLLNEERAWGRGEDDYVPPIALEGKIVKQDLDDVIDQERLKVRITVPKRARVEFQVYLRRPERKTGKYALIGERGGEKAIQLDGPVTRKTAYVPLKVNPPHSVDALRPLSSADLDLFTIARRNRDPSYGDAFHQRTIQK
jgi:hypothetical protein